MERHLPAWEEGVLRARRLYRPCLGIRAGPQPSPASRSTLLVATSPGEGWRKILFRRSEAGCNTTSSSTQFYTIHHTADDPIQSETQLGRSTEKHAHRQGISNLDSLAASNYGFCFCPVLTTHGHACYPVLGREREEREKKKNLPLWGPRHGASLDALVRIFYLSDR